MKQMAEAKRPTASLKRYPDLSMLAARSGLSSPLSRAKYHIYAEFTSKSTSPSRSVGPTKDREFKP